MKRLLTLLIIIKHITTLSGQENQPEIQGVLKTGETLTGVYSSGIFTRNTYVWETADDQNGTQGVKEAGKSQTYKLLTEDAGKFIRLEVTSSNFWGRKTVVYSSWKGPVRNSVPLIKGSVTISGTLKTGNTAYANYVYDPNNYSESGTTFRWYMADGPSGAGSIPVSGGGSSLELQINLENKYLRVEITPRDINVVTGSAYTSSWYGPIQKTEQINNPPVATGVRIRGNPVYCGVLTGLYDYSDTESDAEGASSFRWLRAAEGSTPEPIPNATSNSYIVTTSDKGKYIYFEVTPKAVSGNTSGAAVMSNSTSLIQGDLPTVTFSGPNSICEGANTNITLTFTGNPPFSLEYTNGIKTSNLTTSNYTYQLAINTGGTYQGTKLTDVLNCPVTNLPSSLVITSKPMPELDFSVTNTCFTADSTTFKNTSSKATIKSWSWNFGDAAAPVAQNSSAKEAPKHKYPGPGTYQVWLAAENTEGCRDTVFKTVALGEKPIADLSWNKECYAPNLNITFQNKSVSSAKISKYAWKLSNSGAVMKESTGSELNYTFPSAGKSDIKLKITTDLGCADSITKVFTTKPIIRLQEGMVQDDLESNPGWTIELNSKNNWYRGLPAGTTINSPHSGSNAFYTYFPEKRQSQQLIATSSCYDFTGIQTPFAEMWVNHSNQEGKEGAVLQYMQDGSQAWTTLGGLNTGFNWYNNDSIASKPGNSFAGWSGNSKGWSLVRHSLDLSDKTNIRFRIVYASAADATAGDGFAFDDFYIGQRSKKVLVEYFTNLSDAFSNQSNFIMDSVLNKSGTSAIPIQYHTSFPGPDSLNEDNKANPASRALYYGIGKVPLSLVDGGDAQNYSYDFTARKMSSTDIINRSFEDPRFNLKITSGVLNNTVTGTVKLTALRNLTNLESTLHIAIVEDINAVISGKPLTLKNVLKYMYPSAGGSLLASTWAKDQALEIPFSWNMTNVYNNTKTKVIAFIQHNSTKEVYQTEVAVNSALTSTKDLNRGVLKIYPNPTSGYLWVDFGAELKSRCQITIISSTGKLVKEEIIEGGITNTGITVSGLPSGIYYLKISDAEHVSRSVRFVVNR